MRARLLLAILVLPAIALCQRIENLKAENISGKVIITYDLIGNTDQHYNISVFSSHDNFVAPLKFVVGDVGKSIAAGPGKRVEWDLTKELVTYQGNITFKVRGDVMPIPLTIKAPVENKTVRKGKAMTVTWVGGKQGSPLRIDLIQDGKTAQTISESATNNGMHTWVVPKDIAKGNYQVRLSGGGETATSGAFPIKPKLPILWIAAPIVVGGVIIAILAKGKDPDIDPDLPNSPSPQD
ncbi:MAG TPA: Ser-Thr-rich GPI-anchored membrane family protein [Cyclobacteriaceae bacterium]|nr:Ser-Thr-rich GPI-anchored membrane family protein [Cyclobacteriaceae bacterium]